MGKKKRSAEQKLEYYKEKVRRYENDICINSNADFEGTQPQDYSPTGYTPCHDVPDIANEVILSAEDSETTEVEEDPPEPQGTTTAVTATDVAAVPSTSTALVLPSTSAEPPATDTASDDIAPLDPEILVALGEATDTTPEFGVEIHKKIAQLWTPILKKGLTKESKESLVKEYLIPNNCTLLQSPKLNAEMTAAVTDLCRNRDKKMATSQQQLGVATTAIGRALTILLNTDEKTEKIKAIKHLSDGCRLLCDLHFEDTSRRIKLITPNLDQSFCKLIQDVQRDESLFGEKLSEKIKASKAITRQGLQIKKPNNPKPSPQLASGRPAAVQGNWTGPPRSSNRGGRGGIRRPYNNAMNYGHPRGPVPPQHQYLHPQSNPSNRPRGPAPQRR